MFGSFRRGEANDPATYAAAVTAVLARYPDEVIAAVTDPTSGLPTKQDWLPTVREIIEACEEIYSPIRRAKEWEMRVQQTLAARESEDIGREARPTGAELKAKHGESWGITDPDARKKPGKPQFKSPTLEELQQYYADKPDRIAKLLGGKA